MNIQQIIALQRWGSDSETPSLILKAHNESLDRIEAAATLNELILERFREVNAVMDKRIADLEAENARLREKLIIKAT